jgi:cysteine desulfurase/selenocysteine lyase
MKRTGLLSTALRDDFPQLARRDASGRPFVYLDSAATSLKPRAVIDAMTSVLERHVANVHRATHQLGDEATERFEQAREKVARLIGAEAHELVFVRNTTEGLNLVARGWQRSGRVLLSRAEHHSNLLPWGTDQVTAIPPNPDGSTNEDVLLRELARGGVAVVTVSHVGNVAGGRVDARRLADAAHAVGAILVLDGAQSVPQMPIDVHELDCDFLAFSSHKMCGPSGIGALYGKAERLAELRWQLVGGGVIEELRRGELVAKQPPWRFEAGTPAIEAAVGFGAAVDYLRRVGLEEIETHDRHLVNHALERLREVPGINIVGPRDERHQGPVSFSVAGLPAHLVARTLSDGYGVCVRSGFHCAQPLHEDLRLPATVRLSFYLYNRPEEVDACVRALQQILPLGR